MKTVQQLQVIQWTLSSMLNNREHCLDIYILTKPTRIIFLSGIHTSPFTLQIRNEAQQCTCVKPFQITKVGEGKYTFGFSKIVRLVRIHGASVVVRVGGGWEYLYDFLLKNDPCRGEWLPYLFGYFSMNSFSHSKAIFV